MAKNSQVSTESHPGRVKFVEACFALSVRLDRAQSASVLADNANSEVTQASSPQLESAAFELAASIGLMEVFAIPTADRPPFADRWLIPAIRGAITAVVTTQRQLTSDADDLPSIDRVIAHDAVAGILESRLEIHAAQSMLTQLSLIHISEPTRPY